jgi:hypothetical protein
MTGQDAFRALLRDDVAPLLRREGLVGSGQNFRLVHPSGNVGLVNFQRSHGNLADDVRFYVNLSTVSKVLWDWAVAHGHRHPTATPKEHDGHVRARLESLLPDRDPLALGWELGNGDQRARLARDLSAAFVDIGLPWLEAHLTDEAMRDQWLGRIADGDGFTFRQRTDWDNGCLLVILLRHEGRDDEAARLLGRLRAYVASLPMSQRPRAQARVDVLAGA